MEVTRRLRLTPLRLLPPDSADPVPMGRGITVALLDQAVTFNFALRLSRWPGWVAMEEVQCEPVHRHTISIQLESSFGNGNRRPWAVTCDFKLVRVRVNS
jgi:hypothetical protein